MQTQPRCTGHDAVSLIDRLTVVGLGGNGSTGGLLDSTSSGRIWLTFSPEEYP